jgi:archaellum component FlaC
MEYLKISRRIEEWDRLIICIENDVEMAYEELDGGVDHAPELMDRIKALKGEIEKLEDLIEIAYFEVDKLLYSKAM